MDADRSALRMKVVSLYSRKELDQAKTD